MYPSFCGEPPLKEQRFFRGGPVRAEIQFNSSAAGPETYSTVPPVKTILPLSLSFLLVSGLIPALAGPEIPPPQVPSPTAPPPEKPTPAPGASLSPPAVPAEDVLPKHKTAPPPRNGTEFLEKAARGGTGEMKLADLALKKAADVKVKELAQILRTDHLSMAEHLQTAARATAQHVDEEADLETGKTLAALQKMDGPEFDTAFLDEMARRHEEELNLFEAGKKLNVNGEISTFIEFALPVIKQHAQKIKLLQPGVRPVSGSPPAAAGMPVPVNE